MADRQQRVEGRRAARTDTIGCAEARPTNRRARTMATQPACIQPFSAEGEVVEIFDDGGERRARIVLQRPTVIDVGAGRLGDVHLGDHVVVGGSITVDTIRTAGSGSPSGSS
jgi:hypothetical protein